MYCKVKLKQAIIDAWSMLKGTRGFNYLLGLIVIGVFLPAQLIVFSLIFRKGTYPTILSNHDSLQAMSAYPPAFPYLLILFVVAMFIFFIFAQIWQYTLSSRLWQKKVLVRDFFKNFTHLPKLLPMALISCFSFSLYFLIIESIKNYFLLVIVVLFSIIILLIIGIGTFLYSTYAATTTLSTRNLFQVTFRNKGAIRSLLSLSWCKIKLMLVALLIELAVIITSTIVMGIHSLLTYLIPHNIMVAMHIIYLVVSIAIACITIFAMIYWLLPFLYMYPIAAYTQVVKQNIAAHNLPMHPKLAEHLAAQKVQDEA